MSSTVTLQNSTKVFGAIYAPSADVSINSNAELYGAVIGNNVTIQNNAKVHYDKALGNSSGSSSSNGKTIQYYTNDQKPPLVKTCFF